MWLCSVILVFFLLAVSACSSTTTKNDSLQADTIAVVATEPSGAVVAQSDRAKNSKRKLKCRTEKPLGSHIPRKTCHFEGDLDEQTAESQRLMESIKIGSGG